MSLISKEAAIEALEFERDTNETPERIKGVEDAIEAIQYLSPVPAVPLDKLCEWLSENSINIPCEFCPNFSNDYCAAIRAINKPCLKTTDDWRQAITKWMEKQNGTEEST